MARCRHILIWDARFLMDAEAPEGSSVVQMAPIFDCSLPAGMTVRAMLGTGNTWTVATDEGGLFQVGQCCVLPRRLPYGSRGQLAAVERRLPC